MTDVLVDVKNGNGNRRILSATNELIRKASTDIKEKMEELLQGKEIVVNFDEQIVFEQLDQDENAIWSLMLVSAPPGLAIFKLVYLTSNSFRLFSNRLTSSFFSVRSCFNCAFSCFNSSCKYIKCLSLASKVFNSFLSSSVILYQNCTQI